MAPASAKSRIVDFVKRVPGYRPAAPPPTLVERWNAWLWSSESTPVVAQMPAGGTGTVAEEVAADEWPQWLCGATPRKPAAEKPLEGVPASGWVEGLPVL